MSARSRSEKSRWLRVSRIAVTIAGPAAKKSPIWNFALSWRANGSLSQ